MKFRYYITDMHSGSIKGSDSAEVAASFRHSEDHFVVDTETGMWLTSGEDADIQNIED